MSFLLRLVIALKAVEMNWFPFTYILDNLITNSIHAWLTKDYRSSGMLQASCQVTRPCDDQKLGSPGLHGQAVKSSALCAIVVHRIRLQNQVLSVLAREAH